MNQRQCADDACSEKNAHEPWGEDCDVDRLHDADARLTGNTTEGLHDKRRKGEKDARYQAATKSCNERQDEDHFIKQSHWLSRTEPSKRHFGVLQDSPVPLPF